MFTRFVYIAADIRNASFSDYVDIFDELGIEIQSDNQEVPDINDYQSSKITSKKHKVNINTAVR